MFESVSTGASLRQGAMSISSGAVSQPIDAAKVNRLKDLIPRLNEKGVPVTEAAIAGLEFLSTGSEAGFDEAFRRDRKSPRCAPALPESVDLALRRGASMKYVLGLPPDRLKSEIELGTPLTRGWDVLPDARKQLFPPPPDMKAVHWAKVLKDSFFKRTIEQLGNSKCVVLSLPSNDFVLVARTQEGTLLALAYDTRSPGVTRLNICEGRQAEDRISMAIHMPGSRSWAMAIQE